MRNVESTEGMANACRNAFLCNPWIQGAILFGIPHETVLTLMEFSERRETVISVYYTAMSE